jgi:hypothetical protein
MSTSSNSIYCFKTTAGETLLGELYVPDYEHDGLVFIIFPIKIILNNVMTANGLQSQPIPSLYAQFSDSGIQSYRSSFFVSISQCSDFYERFYLKTLEQLIKSETLRMLAIDDYFTSVDFPDKIIMEPPTSLQ